MSDILALADRLDVLTRSLPTTGFYVASGEIVDELRKIALQNDGCSLIAAERQRQVSAEGWTPEHDDQHDDSSLALAAAVYAVPGYEITGRKGIRLRAQVMGLWPWDIAWFKPCRDAGGRVRELVKAGALIAAEIDRLNRLTTKATP